MLDAFTQKSSSEIDNRFVTQLIERCKALAKYRYEIQYLSQYEPVPVLGIKQKLFDQGIYELGMKFPNFINLMHDTINQQVNKLITDHQLQIAPPSQSRKMIL